jgi:arabinofuranan 3-O-arabinosyltransferase
MYRHSRPSPQLHDQYDQPMTTNQIDDQPNRRPTNDDQRMISWTNRLASRLTPRRMRAQAIVLAVCLWGVCIADFSTPGLLDRAGNIKFQDFLQFYISARLIQQGRTAQLYDQRVADQELQALVGPHTGVRLPTVYPPQVGLLFLPLARFSFPVAARIWTALSMLLYFLCLYAVWRSCPTLAPYALTLLIAALAFPPLFHCFVRGQISTVLLLCFTLAFLALRANRNFLAGAALGMLVFKPPFLVAIPLIFLLARAWKPFAGLVLSALAQTALGVLCFGRDVMLAYFDSLLHPSRWISIAELPLAPIQMHSLRAFWMLLVPWPWASLALYVVSTVLVIGIAAAIWKSSAPLPLRFSALTLAAVLVNPHLFIYDLLVLAPALLLLLDWTLTASQPRYEPALRPLLYLAFILPLFGPLAYWTHLQLSVIAFAMLLWILFRISALPRTTGHKLDSVESAGV